MGLRLLLLVAALLVASPAFALNEWTDCQGGTGSALVNKGECRQFRFDDSLSPLSTTFRVRPDATALVSFIQDSGTASGSATAMIQKCIEGYTASTNTCKNTLASALDGTGGADSAQTFAKRYGPGLYRVAFVAATAGDEAVLQVQGE